MNDEGLCSSTCDVIFISNHTTNTPNNPANRSWSIPTVTPNLFVKLDDGSYVLNDYSNMPTKSAMICPAIPNITQSTQQCSISQAQAASSATSLYSVSLSSIMSSISVLTQQLITYLNTYLHLYYFQIDCIVTSQKSYWMMLVWNLISFSVLRRVMLQLANGL